MKLKKNMTKSEPLGLRVSRVKTKIQVFNDILDAAILSVPVCGDSVEVTERFMSLMAVSQRSIDVWLTASGDNKYHCQGK